ncbi:MAG: twin-arginine translocase subunit TatB [Gammaproteobacteria bacterium HGW-Gammaproteobacteria-1]|jgi:sec-independent protein translocase protein TatB|nr:MAG: twin-arginine translocase subunit TatB [Gammaproteobacteria bacterium HGW-Gammaproteobacteria-1]
MFDVGFWELVIIGIVALLVLGPERLPVVARTVGLWYGKARHFVGTVKADIDRELKAEELKRIVQEQTKSEGLFDMVEEAKASLQDIRSGLESVNRPVELSSLESSSDTTPSITPPAEPDNDKKST